MQIVAPDLAFENQILRSAVLIGGVALLGKYRLVEFSKAGVTAEGHKVVISLEELISVLKGENEAQKLRARAA